MKVTAEEFGAMMKNPHIRIASNSANKGAVITPEEQVRFDKIRASEYQGGAKVRQTTVNKKRFKKSTSATYISPHGTKLAWFNKDPSRIKGHQEQHCQVHIFFDIEVHHPDIYDMMAAIPNGGLRSDKTGRDVKAEGAKTGYPDVTIDAARGIYHGFRLELKMGKNGCSDSQKGYHDKLRCNGYAVVVCFGYDAAMKAILEYWSLSVDGVMSAEVYK